MQLEAGDAALPDQRWRSQCGKLKAGCASTGLQNPPKNGRTSSVYSTSPSASNPAGVGGIECDGPLSLVPRLQKLVYEALREQTAALFERRWQVVVDVAAHEVHLPLRPRPSSRWPTASRRRHATQLARGAARLGPARRCRRDQTPV